jgi:hypothetical protein
MVFEWSIADSQLERNSESSEIHCWSIDYSATPSQESISRLISAISHTFSGTGDDAARRGARRGGRACARSFSSPREFPEFAYREKLIATGR